MANIEQFPRLATSLQDTSVQRWFDSLGAKLNPLLAADDGGLVSRIEDLEARANPSIIYSQGEVLTTTSTPTSFATYSIPASIFSTAGDVIKIYGAALGTAFTNSATLSVNGTSLSVLSIVGAVVFTYEFTLHRIDASTLDVSGLSIGQGNLTGAVRSSISHTAGTSCDIIVLGSNNNNTTVTWRNLYVSYIPYAAVT